MRKLRPEELINLYLPEIENKKKRETGARAVGLYSLFSFLRNPESKLWGQLPLMGEWTAEASAWTVSSQSESSLVLQYFSPGLVYVMKNFPGAYCSGCL